MDTIDLVVPHVDTCTCSTESFFVPNLLELSSEEPQRDEPNFFCHGCAFRRAATKTPATEKMDGEPSWWSPDEWTAFQERMEYDRIFTDTLGTPVFALTEELLAQPDDDPFLVRFMQSTTPSPLVSTPTSEECVQPSTPISDVPFETSSAVILPLSLVQPPKKVKRVRTLPVLPALLQSGDKEFYRVTHMKPPCQKYHVESLMDCGPTLYANHKEAQMLISNWKFYRGRMLNQWTFDHAEEFEPTKHKYEELALDVHHQMTAAIEALRSTALSIQKLHEFLSDPVTYTQTGKTKHKFTSHKR